MAKYKPQTIGEVIEILSSLDKNEIVVGVLFTAEDLQYYPDLDEYADDYEAIKPSPELMAKVAETYDNSNEALYLLNTLEGWLAEEIEKGK